MADTPLCRAPHFNVWKDGRICTGNVKLPETMTPEVLADYERAFFGSNFTHPNDAAGLTRHPRGAYGMWRELVAGKRAQFPASWLSPLTDIGAAAVEPPKKRPQVILAAAIKHLEESSGRRS